MQKSLVQHELLLSSIPSILIGVAQNGVIAHWNHAAENMFGLPAASVLNRPFAECPIQWNTKVISEAMSEARKVGSAIRLDDIVFTRPTGEKRILGVTLIPVPQEEEDSIECVIFGADITDRKRVEELKNEFVSTVSHELRTPLTIIKEGVSQVLEGLLGSLNEEQKHFLDIALENIDRLGRIVDDLLDISKIEAGRLELKREMVDIGALAKSIVIPFRSKGRLKGVEIVTDVPEYGATVYVDEDRIIQVFTNLIDNALKFTERGQIEVFVRDRKNLVECRVKDTGKGIVPGDLPKVFGKFQQFHRHSTEKGTGLGLAICKGIVDAHQGQIAVQSKSGEGTAFTFTLPKHTSKELFQKQVENALKEVAREESCFSFVVFEIGNIDLLLQKMGVENSAMLFQDLEALLKANLPRKAQIVMRDNRALFVLLPDIPKEQALIVAGRIQKTFDDHLSKRKMKNKVEFACKVVTFPQDGSTLQKLLEKLGGI